MLTPLYADNITRGVSEYLIDRAKDNHFYLFEQKLKSNQDLACYFPNTFAYIQNGDLKSLLQANELWAESIDNDLESLIAKSVAYKIKDTHNLSKIAIDATNEYLELTQYLYIVYKKKRYELNVLPINRTHPVVNQLNSYYFGFLDFRAQLLELSQFLAQFNDICKAPNISAQQFQNKMDKLSASFDKYSELIKFVEKNGEDLHVDLKKLNIDCRNGKSDSNICKHRENILSEFLSRRNGDLKSTVNKILTTSTTLKDYATRANNYNTQAARVVFAFRNLPKNNRKNVNVEKLKKSALFFAQLADSESPEAIKSILNEHTLPTVSFAIKREHRELHALLTSYLGFAVGTGVGQENSIGQKYGQSIFAPVGLELSYGYKRFGSISVLASVIDVGYPISLKLNNVEDDVDFNQTIAPSLSFAYGFKNQPIVMGLSYQKGRKNMLNNRYDDFLFLFAAYDMPLLTLY